MKILTDTKKDSLGTYPFPRSSLIDATTTEYCRSVWCLVLTINSHTSHLQYGRYSLRLHTMDSDDTDLQGSANLDQALLESLFYHEMALMEDDSSSLLPPHLFSSLFSSTPSDHHHSNNNISNNADPGTIAEKALLSDFGVNSLPVSTQWESTQQQQQQAVLPQPSVPGSHSQQHASSRPMALQPPTHQTTKSKITLSQGVPVPNPSYAHASSSNQSNNMPPVAPAPTHALPPEEKRKKLVSQFAMLASRLGITLPPQVVQVLQTTVDSAMENEAVPVSTTAAAVPASYSSVGGVGPQHHSQSAQSGSVIPPAVFPARHEPAPLPPMKATPAVQQLQSTAEAAIAAVTNRKRSAEQAVGSNGNNNDSADNGKGAIATLAHSKRRKKPRLADCETRLADLKSENELLKRHLHNIANQSHKFDQERLGAETRMTFLLKQEAADVEMDSAIKNYTELYSDYGRRRHQELTFHLEQLQRLANPTNFTKMGLWSLENSNMDPKRNPVAGILQKELAITGQQGRKILEQRQKIRDVCANLKECFALIGKLKALCEQKTKIFHDRMSKCREILSPKQVVKLLIWIDGHSHLLESVCPGWQSERIQSKTKPKKS